jgi:hypothetical protein
LRYDTLRLGATLPDLQRRQVFDDLAILAADPRDLPYFALVYGGTANVTDQAGGSLSFVGVVGKYTQGTYGLAGQRQITGNWSVKPINDPYRLAAIRCACLLALDLDQYIEPIDLERLRALLGQNYPGFTGDPREIIPTGWICRGEKRFKPKAWPYYACIGDEYIWVNPERLRDFTNFVLIVLDLATISSSTGRDLPQEAAPAKNDKTTAELKDLISDLKLIKEHLAKAKSGETKRALIRNAAEQQKQGELMTGLKGYNNLSLFASKMENLDLETNAGARDASDLTKEFEKALDTEINHVESALYQQEQLQQQQPVRAPAILALPPRIDESPPSVNPGLFFIPRPS